MGFDVYDDFYAYHEGVYEVSSSAKKLGMHAVSVIGWGTENGVDYWLMQNSWGPNMGDEGVWKFKRGTNMCNVERETPRREFPAAGSWQRAASVGAGAAASGRDPLDGAE
eukprot:1982708-Rhodomonas_salina.2